MLHAQQDRSIGCRYLQMSNVLLRDVMEADLPVFYEQQLGDDANRMAAFTRKDPTDRGAFDAHWAKILGDRTITVKTVLFDGCTFTATPAVVTAHTDLTIEDVGSTAPGLRGRIVERVASGEMRRTYQEARHITAQKVIQHVSQAFDATVQEHLDRLNRRLRLKRLMR